MGNLLASEASLAFEECLFHGVGRRFYIVAAQCANDEVQHLQGKAEKLWHQVTCTVCCVFCISILNWQWSKSMSRTTFMDDGRLSFYCPRRSCINDCVASWDLAWQKQQGGTSVPAISVPLTRCLRLCETKVWEHNRICATGELRVACCPS